MRQNFGGKGGKDYHDGWEAMWQAGDFLPWDRMVPSPALSDTLDNHTHVVGTANLVLPDGSSRRKRALVPGCGRGVDVMLLQAYGYDVVGLEYSPTAVEACKQYAKETENEELYKTRDAKLCKGSRVFVQGDFYADDWLERAGISEKEGVFELIYDYTVSAAFTSTSYELTEICNSFSAPCTSQCGLHGPSVCQLCWHQILKPTS